jgi:multisubunit Na+/H+ antiporter MnhG subunit
MQWIMIGLERFSSMNTRQKQGIIAIIVGFVLTTIAGLALTFFANDTFGLLLSAVFIFLLIAPIFGFGIYRYAQSSQEESVLLAEEMEKPRQLLDILKEKGQADIASLSQELDSDASNIKTMIEDLISLNLFRGIINWDDGIIALVDPNVLALMETCKNCSQPIDMNEQGVTICKHCGTEYHQI